jgi:ribosomal protein S18 acetylase RimI-like enzyme
MDPVQDLKAIADLIAEAFADEMDERGRAALREMRWMGRLSPLIWWWSRADPAFQDTFNGFVWEEVSPQGKNEIVGNVSLNRTPGNRQRWIICNVVVQEAFRRRGIARRLTEAAIAEARHLGAGGVILQVYQNNLPALRLYSDLGFREAAGETYLRLSAVREVRPRDLPDYQIRPWRPGDGLAVYELADSVTPPVLRWINPLRRDKYRPDWWTRQAERLADLLAGRQVHRLTLYREGRLVAMMSLTAVSRHEDHKLHLLVDPEHGDRVSAALLSRALYGLAAMPARPVGVNVYKDQTATLRALSDFGFHEQRTLLTLSRDF